MKKSTLILVATFVVLLIVTYLLLRPSGEKITTYKISERIVDIDSAAVEKIELKTPDRQIVLEKMGGQWMLTSPLHYPASPTATEQLLTQLKDIKLESLISSNPEKQSLFKVDSSGTVITVYEHNAAKPAFIVGKEGSDYLSVYVRKVGSNDVYLAQGLHGYTINKQVHEWRDKTIFKTVPQSISQITFHYGDTTFALRQTNNMWFVDTDSAQQGTVESFLNAISNLQADDFIDSTITKLPAPRLILDIAAANNGQIRLYPAGKDVKKYIVQVAGFSQLFELMEYSAERLMKHRKDFVKQ
jgi:hypothetical protein